MDNRNFLFFGLGVQSNERLGKLEDLREDL